ncbi:30S ribosomal protein S16 [Chloracidobacterium sp. MS 40/45]|uniref:30S ribosomal protein S16 n=1 Tax=Chloracidobacterium aggregatum TaxID=2851959 RepID=UPI001B8D4303|nr:30S ribosomal protein S16 [Chloracidobacterium aggregatum]QUV99597.1 30S ribosomal protein S16 [Chloracidobacterium sp. MS 40/45]
MLSIRLTRRGTHRRPFYRIVVAEKRSKRDGGFIEVLGYRDPLTNPEKLVVRLDRVDYWLKCGAQPSDTVRALIARARREAETATPEASA